MNDNSQLMNLLHHYISKYQQIQDGSQEKDLFEQFRRIIDITYQQQEQQITIYSSQISTSNQNIAHYTSSIVNLEMTLESIRQQREQIHYSVDLKEQELQTLENSIQSKSQVVQHTQKLADLIEGVSMCTEKCQLLHEENQDFTKMAQQLTIKHQDLKQQHSKLQTQYDNNLSTLSQLQQEGLGLNYRMMKQLKIINDLQQFINNNNEYTPDSGMQKKCKLENFINDFCALEDTCIIYYKLFEFLENELKGLNIVKNTQESEVIESLNQIIVLKKRLASMNMKENSDSSPRYKQTDSILVSDSFRFKTHHNLGEKQIRKRQISQGQNELKAYSELDEGDEIQESSSESQHQLVHKEARQPWHNRISSFQVPQEMESDQKNKCKSHHSIASVSSNSSYNRLGVMTLHEELKTTYHHIQVDEEDDLKERDTELNESVDVPVQIESIIEIPTKESYLIEEEKPQIGFFRKVQIAGAVIATVGLAGWLYKKYF